MVDKLKEQGIKQIVFDRNGHPYVENGRSDFFCKTIREGGIKV
jgi:ribosomal protein L18